MHKFLVISAILLVPTNAALVANELLAEISFNRDIRPILSRNCFPCHGPDETSRQADIRLDRRQDVISNGSIDLDDLATSVLLERIHSDDPDLIMPPPDSGKSLSAKQRETITAWVTAGAYYEAHWAFVPPIKPQMPQPNSTPWARNVIDEFLLAAMDAADVHPQPRADRHTLVRRLFQDLVGLIPTPTQTEAFLHDQSPHAYERLVDRLLASPRYGEHMARSWLDLARYADTNGYEKDRPRSIWPYRDWVVDAINEDMPFDQFTIEQLAGDILPDATVSQRIATGFHRNTMLNEEGGIDPLEYRFYAMVDRVATTGTVWMGLTVGCAQCHSHKYDPISHVDYYRLLALLNNADEPDLRFTSEPSSSERNAAVLMRIREREDELVAQVLANEITGSPASGDTPPASFSAWKQQLKPQAAAWKTAKPRKLSSNLPKLERLADDSVFASGDFTKRDEYYLTLQVPGDQALTALRIEALPDERLPASGPGRTYYEGRKGQFFLSEVELSSKGEPIVGVSASYSNSQEPFQTDGKLFDTDGSTGWTNDGQAGIRHTAVIRFEKPLTTRTIDVRMLFERHFVASLGRFKFSVTTHENPRALGVHPAVEQLLTRAESEWSEADRRRVALEFVMTSPSMSESKRAMEQLRKLQSARHETLVMEERPADNSRPTHRHHRGEWLNPREIVTGDVPACFPSLPDDQRNRLGLARWLVSDDNPLFARVVVNRAWRHFMGQGFVRSDGDFGTQSSPPTHPQLLDWLACEFVDQGMSQKWLHRQIVLSAAYQQQSRVDPDDRDPNNRYFARGPRHRVSGEMIRDMILVAGETLSSQMGGRSVRPPQPNSVTQVAYGNPKWNASTGEDRFRRSLYTFSKRTAPFAAFTTFDGPSGETCVARRHRSNTPLQALTLLNDEMFVELVRHVGRTVNREHVDARPRVETVFRRLLTRPPTNDELQHLQAYYARQLRRLQQGELSAREIGAEEQTTPELAALIMVARVVMNLDEMVTKH